MQSKSLNNIQKITLSVVTALTLVRLHGAFVALMWYLDHSPLLYHCDDSPFIRRRGARFNVAFLRTRWNGCATAS
jgi:hypothetical protein